MSLLFETSIGDLTIDFDFDKFPRRCRSILESATQKKYAGTLFTEGLKDSLVVLIIFRNVSDIVPCLLSLGISESMETFNFTPKSI